MSTHIRYAEETDASILAGFQLKMVEETEGYGGLAACMWTYLFADRVFFVCC